MRLYTPYIIWIVLIFVLHIQDWWLSYKLRSVEVWTLHSFLLIIVYPINLYILAHLLFPAQLSKDFDSKAFYLTFYPRLFIGAIILVVLSMVQNVLFSAYGIESQIPQFIVLSALFFVVLKRSKSSVVHFILTFLLLLLMIVSFIIDQENLTIY